jgi:hypothetical protein
MDVMIEFVEELLTPPIREVALAPVLLVIDVLMDLDLASHFRPDVQHHFSAS